MRKREALKKLMQKFGENSHLRGGLKKTIKYCQTPVLGLGIGVDFTLAWDNHNHNNHNHNHKNDNNPPLNFVKGTVLGDKEQGVGIRDKRYGIKGKTKVVFDTEDQVLSNLCCQRFLR